jgi:hypothetical protein
MFRIYQVWLGLWIMMFNATFNNISAILWWSVLLVEETEVPGENHQPVALLYVCLQKQEFAFLN